MKSASKMICYHFEKNFHLFEYLEIRDLLQDIVSYFSGDKGNQSRPQYTITHLAALLGFNSAAHFLLILSGARNLTLKQSEILAAALDLDAARSKYLKLMAVYSKEKSLTKKRNYLEELKAYQKKSNLKDAKLDLFLSSFANGVAYELLLRTRTMMSIEEVSQSLGKLFTKAQLKRSLTTLVELGLCEQHEGLYHVVNEHDIITERTVHSATVGSYYCEILDSAAEAIMKIPAEERFFKTLTLTVEETKIQEFQRLLERFSAEAKKLSGEVNEDSDVLRVMQATIAVFPVSDSIRRDVRKDKNEKI